MPTPIKLARSRIEADPDAIWNAFVHFLVLADLNELNPVQRAAYLAFSYESEVCNGGHCQYFQNRGVGEIDSVVEALKFLKMSSLAEVAHKAAERIRVSPPRAARTVEEFCDIALEGRFDDLDKEFYQINPTISDTLQGYLRDHETDFIERIP